MHYALGVTIEQVRQIFAYHLHARVSAGGLVAIWQRQARLLEAWYEQIARQALRAGVPRKNSQSNRSEKGAAVQAVLMSVYRTLQLRGHDPLKTGASPSCFCVWWWCIKCIQGATTHTWHSSTSIVVASGPSSSRRIACVAWRIGRMASSMTWRSRPVGLAISLRTMPNSMASPTTARCAPARIRPRSVSAAGRWGIRRG